jgi:hypothetical protein
MKKRFWMSGLIVAGLCLLVAGSQWSRLRPVSAYWSADQAAEYTAAHADLHAEGHHFRSDAETAKEIKAARERVQKIDQELEQARTSRSRGGTLLIVAGLALLAVGIGLNFVSSGEKAEA